MYVCTVCIYFKSKCAQTFIHKINAYIHAFTQLEMNERLKFVCRFSDSRAECDGRGHRGHVEGIQ